MSAVNESVVREYFEFLGFLVIQPRKYAALGRGKSAEEEIDLLVWNPLAREHVMPEHLVWGTDDLRTVAKAVIGVRGWHTERFYVSTFAQTPEILRFAESDCTKIAARMLGDGPMAKVLCLPRLPASGELKRRTIQTLKDKGVDGVISFKTMLTEIIRRVETNRNYEKSDLLQTIRMLKNYDLIAGGQMELFAGNRHSPRRRKDEAADEG